MAEIEMMNVSDCMSDEDTSSSSAILGVIHKKVKDYNR